MHLAAVFYLLLLAGSVFAAEFRNEIQTVPTMVEEEKPFKLTVSYTLPKGSAKLHCEMKNTSNIVIAGEAVEISGEGTHTFTLIAPAHGAESKILVGVWLGENWQQALAPIRHTPVIRVLSHAGQRRLETMKAGAEVEARRLKGRRTPKGHVAILDDALPGLDASLAGRLAGAFRKRGIGVSRLKAEAVANPYLLTRRNFDMLVLCDGRIFPAEALDSLQAYTESGGSLIALNGPSFSRLVWKSGGRWLDKVGILDKLAQAPGRRVFMDFEEAELALWRRATNDFSSPGSIAFDAPGAEGTARSAHITIADMTGWDTFESPEMESPFPAGHVLTQFWAKGDGRTDRLAIEWREKDGSRWIATVPLMPAWKRYALPPTAFQYWQDSASQGRGGAGDHFNPASACRLTFGLAYTHTPTVGGGKHEFYIDEIASAPMPEGMEGIESILQADPAVPIIEGTSPAYKLYDVPGLKGLRPDSRQTVWQPRLPLPARTMAVHPRPQGTGFRKNRRWRWIPLLEALNRDGRPGGAPAALVINGRQPYEGALWLSVPVTDPAFWKKESVLQAIAGAAERMLDGVYLYEGGSRYFAYQDGEAVEIGAELVNFGKRPAKAEAVFSVMPAGGGKPVITRRYTASLSPGKRQVYSAVWKPGRFASTDYRVNVSLLRDGRLIDRLQHSLSVWRPDSEPAFIGVRAGDFILKGRKWYPHGVNYMPSTGIGIEDGEYFEFWLDPQPYDPDCIECDLRDISAMGMNMVSVFIYYRSLDSHNLLDLLNRCRKHGLKVNLSLRPGTPMDFRWNEMRALIERHRLAQNDTVFAYDLAWEPFFGSYETRKQWDARWEEWVLSRYGSIENAEKAWDFPIPRADGKITGPSNRQVAGDGPWTKMAVAYRDFVDALVHQKYAEARRLVKSIDPNHPVSFRMTVAGDPTAGQEAMPYDLKGLAGAVDIMCPEGYGRIGDWNRVKDGWFTAAYARSVAPNLPVMWAEFGNSVWDNSRMAVSPKALDSVARFYRDFYEMALRSGANGVVAWWFPGGFRWGENSDFGILNPDRTWRPVTRVIHDYAPRMTAEREIPRPDFLIPITRENHADGIRGIYAAVKDAFWEAIEEGKTPGLRWEK